MDGNNKLSTAWSFWCRLPAKEKHTDYSKDTVMIAPFNDISSFWAIYSRLKRPAEMPNSADMHLFRDGIQPFWEDPGNCNGGKWIVRLRKV
jgi:translation initiation factor 4E